MVLTKGMGFIKYRPEIDGLRAIALIPVLFFHAGFKGFSGGYVGVDVFFVISGYLITHLILAEKQEQKFSIINFYERRARRILPALFFMMFLVLLPAWFLMMPNQLKEFGKSLVLVTLFSSNLVSEGRNGYFQVAVEIKPLLHTWSLAVEEQFYIFFPLIISAVWPYGRKNIFRFLIGATILLLLLSKWQYSRDSVANFYFFSSRAWELLIGAILASHEALSFFELKVSKFLKNILGLCGVLMIFVSVIFFSPSTPFPSAYTLLPVFGAAFVIAFADSQNLLGKILSNRLFVGVGLISYSAYLWHQPLFAFARLSSLGQPSQFVFGSLIVVTLILATLSWKFVERPFRDRARYTSRQIVLWAGALSAMFIGIGISLYVTNGLDGFVDKQVQNFNHASEAVDPRKKDCEAGPGHYVPPVKACSLGDTNVSSSIAVMGDSQAGAMFYSLDQVLLQKKKKALLLSYAACPPIPGLSLLTFSKTHICNEYNEEVFSFLKNSPQISTVILVARWTIYFEGARFKNGQGGDEYGWPIPATFILNKNESLDEDGRKKFVAQAYQEGVKNILKMGKKVILIYPTPEVGWNVPEYLFKSVKVMRSELSAETASTSFSQYEQRNRKTIDILDAIEDNPHLTRIYPDKIFCNSFVASRCVVHEKGMPFYSDDNHLTEAGAEKIIQQILLSKFGNFEK